VRDLETSLSTTRRCAEEISELVKSQVDINIPMKLLIFLPFSQNLFCNKLLGTESDKLNINVSLMLLFSAHT
jgi:hypothetical protein